MDSHQDIIVIIPTYNEVENIQKIIPTVLEQDARLDILVVDDNSPDGTAEAVIRWTNKTPRVKILQREAKMGLGTAYVAGFQYALQRSYKYIFEMDADFSHDPKEIPRFIEAIQDHDLVIGSRYIKGVNVVNWPLSRLLLSYCANYYTKIVTGMSLHDATGGYKCFRREVLEAIDLEKIRSDGYAFQIEMNFNAWRLGFRICEIPIIFVDRFIGVSKMSSDIISEAAFMVWRLRISNLFRRKKK